MRKLIFTLLLISSSFLLKAQTTVFSEDFENPPGNVTSSGTPGWFTCSTIQAGGLNSDSSAIVAPGDVSYLETAPFDCSFNFFVTLSFQSIAKIEFFDNATIEYSIDGGGTWEKLVDDLNGVNNNCVYMGTGLFRTQGSRFEEASYASWLPGQVVSPDNSWWKSETFDISNIAGGQPDVRLRFKNADNNNSGGAGRAGWYVDDISVVASFCELIAPTVICMAPNYPATVYNLGPFPVNVSASDASAIGTVTLNYSVNGVPQTPISMTNPAGDSIYTAMIPPVDTFDVVCYNVEVMDGSFCANIGYCPGPTSSDSICFSVEGGITFPYCDNFDLTTGLWTVNTPTPGTAWELGTPAYGATNSAHSAPWAWDINLTTPYTNSATAILQSPEFSFVPVGAGATLEFWQNRNSEAGWDGTRLEWATDTLNGPWNVLGSVGCIDCINWYTDPQLNSSNLPAWEGSSGGWVKSSIILDAQFNNLPQVWFRFVFTSDGSVITDGFSIDDFCLSLPQPDDVGVSAIIQPGPTGPAGNCVNVIIEVKNYGLNTQTTFPVTYVLTDNLGNQLTQTATWTGNLTPGATAQFTFPVCDTIPVGIFNLCAWTSLPGDANNYNDTLCIVSLGIPVFQLTACDDFENGNMGYQSTSTNIGAAEWQLGAPAFGATFGAYSGTNAWDINLTNGYGVNATASLVTPIYDLTSSVNAYLSFRRNQMTATNDGLRIYYDFNGLGAWTLLGTVNDPNGYNWYNNINLNFGDAGWDGSSNGWQESRYYLQDLITLVGGPTPFIQFRFDFVSGFNGTPNDGVSIDDLCVKQPGPDDIGVVSITQPSGNAPANSTSIVDVVLRNFGSAPQTTFPVYYSVDSMGVVVASGNATFNGTLLPGVPQTFAMPAFTVPSGQFEFCAWTELPGDSDNDNDTTCINSVGVPVIPLSYTAAYIDNFDATNVGWSTTVTGNAGSIWELGVPAFGQTNSAHSAPNAWDVNLNSAYTANAECTLYSPIFDLTNAVDAKLSFWRNHNTEQNWDGVRMEYSKNGGAWTLLGAANATAPCWVNWYNMATINCSGQPAWAGATGGWIKTEANCLPMFDNSLVQFRLIFCSDPSVQIDGFSVDDWQITIPVPLTASPLTVNTNTINNSFIFPGQSVQFTSPISNPGTTPLTSVNATITITPVGQTIPVLTFTDPIAYSPALAAQANLPHIFSQLWTATPGVYDVCVITSEPNNGIDLNPFDDTTCITISVFDSVTITAANPYCTDFETGPQWVSVNAFTYSSTTNDWELGTPTQTIINGAYSGTNAWTIDLDANYSNRDTSGLFSPVFSIDNSKCYKLSFRHKYDTEPFADGGTVEYSTDYAQTWQHLGFASSQPQPWFNTPFITALGGTPGLPGWSGTETNWVLAEQTEQFYNGNTVIFRFRFASDNTVNNYEGWAIDDVCFEEATCVTGISDPESNGVVLGQNFPNPFNGTSTIDYVLPSSGNVKISITNVIGQEIAVPVNGEKAAGQHSVTINSRELGSGIYYYTLEFDRKQITRKMIITE